MYFQELADDQRDEINTEIETAGENHQEYEEKSLTGSNSIITDDANAHEDFEIEEAYREQQDDVSVGSSSKGNGEEEDLMDILAGACKLAIATSMNIVYFNYFWAF